MGRFDKPFEMAPRPWLPTKKNDPETRTVLEMPPRTWIPTPKARFQDVRICDGLNQALNPLDIGMGQATSILNFVPFEYPTLAVRKGYTQNGTTRTGHYITHLRKYNGTLVYGDKYGVYKHLGGAWTNIIDNVSPAERYWQMVQYDNNLYMVDGLSKVQKYNGSSTSAVTDTPTNSKHITLHANRMFLVADDEPNVIRWSKYENPDVFNTFLGDNSDSGFQPISSNVNDPIVGIVTFRDRVVIFKKYSFHELYGERGYDFAINDISTHVGCAAWRTICEVNGVLYFLGNDGVYPYSGGNIPRMPISDPVREYINDINYTYLDQCVAGTDGRRYFLTLVTGLNSSPNVTLMYDPEKARTGPDNGWFVMSYSATAFLDDEENWYTGTSVGKIFNMNDGDTDAGTDIAYEVVTKPIVNGSWHVKKRLNKLKMIVDIPSGATMDIYYSTSTDGNDWELIKTLSPTADVVNAPIVLVGKRSEWFRIKVSGTGRVKIYATAYEVE